jgi:hypothetical protein
MQNLERSFRQQEVTRVPLNSKKEENVIAIFFHADRAVACVNAVQGIAVGMVPEYCLIPRVWLRHVGDLWIVHVGAEL